MNGFNGLLAQHRGGATHDAISEAIREVVAGVTDERKPGTVTITVTVKPLGKGDGLSVSIECKAKPPKQAPGTSVFFATADNNLVREDPRQSDLPLREIRPAPHSALAQ